MKTKLSKYFFIVLSTIIAAGTMYACKNKNMKQEEPAINVANMDTTVKPGDDFFRYANGQWMKNNPIPDEYSIYGSFEELRETNNKQLRTIMEEAMTDKKAAKGSVKQKIADFYSSGMDSASIEKTGIKAIQKELEKIDAINNPTDLINLVAFFHTSGITPLFYFFSGQDDKNSEKVIAQLYQGGLGLPDRDYYTAKDAHSAEIRTEYLKHLGKSFELSGKNKEQASRDAETVMQIETRLAEASLTRLELRDPIKNYNKTDLAGLKKMAPQFNWDTYFSAIGLKATSEINVGQPKFFAEMAKMINEIPVEHWKIYFKWHLIHEASPYLSSAFEKEQFNFYGGVLSGIKEMKPRWKRVLNTTSSSLGEAVGQLYVEKYFPSKAKERMLTLVGNLKEALKERIEKLSWMGEATKKEAVAKLTKMNLKVGYPEKWIDYSSLDITKGSYFQNIMAASRFEFARDLNKIGKPVDRSEWGMTPQTVNAYYSPNMNEIVFPAAILQPPFFFMDGDDAVNYGGIGVVIGHEMTHGFDDQGRQYDKDGNLRDWWTEEDATNFKKQTQVLVDQFNGFKLLDSLHVDGQLTLGENIADMGGITVALVALKKAMQGKDMNAKIDGFTHLQRFFLSYAQIWRGNTRDKELMRRLKEDVHSPKEARVNGQVYNIPEFYTAFDIKQTDKFYKAENLRPVIW
ncbi:MAG TPA: M13 family metallopeptidase [Bacteroidales bacterium]|nr:M13 family metallopeptidase [Bacteroidales bacterium]